MADWIDRWNRLAPQPAQPALPDRGPDPNRVSNQSWIGECHWCQQLVYQPRWPDGPRFDYQTGEAHRCEPQRAEAPDPPEAPAPDHKVTPIRQKPHPFSGGY